MTYGSSRLRPDGSCATSASSRANWSVNGRANRHWDEGTRGSRMAIRSRKERTAVVAATFWRAGRCTPATGQTLYMLTGTGWQGVRYESDMSGKEPVLYLPLPGVRQDVVIVVPREARFAWPEDIRAVS